MSHDREVFILKMAKFLLGVFFLVLFLDPPDAKANIRNNCFKKWKTDYDMVEYCIDQQSAALAKLKRIPNSGIKSRCATKWGQQYDMVVYCIEQQSGSANRLGVTRESTPRSGQIERRPPGSNRGSCSSYIISNGEKICI